MSMRDRRCAIICITLVILGTGCTRDRESVSAPGPQQFTDFSSGEEQGKYIYVGLTLGDNDVGALFPELWGDGHAGTVAAQGPDQAAAVEELKNELLSRVPTEAGNPYFFCEFANAMRSGDHVLIEDYYTQATRATKTALQRLADEQEAEYIAYRQAGGDPEGGYLKSGAWYIMDDDYVIDNGEAAVGLGQGKVWRKVYMVYHIFALNNVAAVHIELAMNVHQVLNVHKYVNRTRGPENPEEMFGAAPGPFELQRAAWIDMVATRLYGQSVWPC